MTDTTDLRDALNAATEQMGRARPITRASSVQLGLTITLCIGMFMLAWQASTIKADALREIREQYVNKDLFNAKFDMIAVQQNTTNEKLSDLKAEVAALRAAGGK